MKRHKFMRWVVRKLADRCGLVTVPYERSLEWTREAGDYLRIAGKNDQSHPYKAGVSDGKARQLHQLVQDLFGEGAR